MMSNSGKMGLRHPPIVFTEQGVAMLSSVLSSQRAIQVNIQIMGTFAQIKKTLSSTDMVLEKKLKILKMF